MFSVIDAKLTCRLRFQFIAEWIMKTMNQEGHPVIAVHLACLSAHDMISHFKELRSVEAEFFLSIMNDSTSTDTLMSSLSLNHYVRLSIHVIEERRERKLFRGN